MDFFVWSTIVLTVWSALGPLVGILIGHRISKAWQKQQWVLENKKEEYREVIAALSSALGPIIACVAPGLLVGPEQLSARHTLENLSYETLGSRIFIAAELNNIRAYDRWADLIADFEKHKDDKAFALGFRRLAEDIRAAALRSLSVK